MATLKATCLGFTRLPSPLESRDVKNYYAIVDIDSIFNLNDWRELNVRDPKEFGRVPNQIRTCLLGNEAFLLINRGLTISAKEARFNNQTNLLEIDVEDKELHGLMDGGHTYLQLEKFKQSKEERQVERQFVKIEILTGLTKDRIVDVVAGRNTSNQVKEVSLAELDGAFKEVKQVLANQSYANLIAYSEYEEMDGVDGKRIAKPISVVEILKCLTCMDAENFNEERHPFRTATSDDKVIQHFKKYKQEIKALHPLLPSILQLWDTIYKNFVNLYNASGGKAGSIGGADNRFFKELRKTKRTLHFIADTSEWAFADSLRLPVLAGFRAALTKTKSGYSWKTGIDPSDFFMKEVGSILTRIVCQSLIDTQDPTRTSRTESVWRHCYTEVELALYKKSPKSMAVAAV